MVACHLNFQFQVLVLLKGTKELGVAHYTMDNPLTTYYLAHILSTTYFLTTY